MILVFRRRRLMMLLFLLVMTAFVYAIYWRAEVRAEVSQEAEVLRQAAALLQNRGAALVKGNEQLMAGFYDRDSKYGNWAWEHEQRRIKYVQAWAAKRGLKLVRYKVDFKSRVTAAAQDDFKVYARQYLTLGYRYPGKTRVREFSIGTRHYIRFIKKDGRWLVRRDWYTDPLDEDTLVPEVIPADGRMLSLSTAELAAMATTPNGRYNRRQAVDYATKFWRNYNQAYRDYTGNGGDCTNFISQVLGDKTGGGLPTDWDWYYRGGGSVAWTQTDSFLSHLLHSGYAQLVAKCNFQEVTKPTVQHPKGIIQELRVGDIIAFEEKNDVVHFTVITGRDEQGYLLLNSHTADRSYVPWDLGWDRKTVFWLMQIKD